MALQDILYNIPEVKHPVEKKVSFNEKLKWTLIVLTTFFILANVRLYGVTAGFLERFEFLQLILATDFGSIISLGIGPIVTSSIILQLLVGSGILNLNTHTEEGKKLFQGIQKIGVLFFILFESVVFVLMGGIQAVSGYAGVVIFQLILGGIAIMYMDEITQKWGFGSGVSLFILAGVARSVFTGFFQFMDIQNGSVSICLADGNPCTGRFFVIIQSLINGAPTELIFALLTILVTIGIFLLVVWAQSLKVEIPLSYDRLRGYNVKWPLQFIYASTIPVILVAALAANVSLFGSLLQNWLGHPTFMGAFSQGVPTSGLAFWIGGSGTSVNLLQAVIRGSIQGIQVVQVISQLLFYMIFSALFAVFWVKTSGTDAAGQAKKIINSGLQIPGFRKDERVLESVLSRYVMPLTIMGGLAIGVLAALTDILGAITSGTAILLAVMIAYQMYQNIAHQHAVDMHPALRRFMG
ncbi:MAG: preprotein translocase subunit SecY [Nanoarchaeota archaeon]